ncbi:hypothetical protein, partial [Streptomyces sp. NRRL B-1140]|uniref:hypothetical protein n=1 Tax=Streptomyces sp. NRRL B-1140 TaxID=1415549 RepID=UPI001F2AB7AD
MWTQPGGEGVGVQNGVQGQRDAAQFGQGRPGVEQSGPPEPAPARHLGLARRGDQPEAATGHGGELPAGL